MEWLPTPVFLPGEFHGQRRLADYSLWSCKESDTIEQLTRSLIYLLYDNSMLSISRHQTVSTVAVPFYTPTSNEWGFQVFHILISTSCFLLFHYNHLVGVLEKTIDSPLDCKEIPPVHPKGNQSWIFVGRTDIEAEISVLWPPDAKSWLVRKDPDAGKGWRWEEKGMIEDEMVGWHHRLNGHEFE